MAGVWKTVKVGGGGFITGIDKSNDETTIVCRADTYGAYIWNTTLLAWDQLLTYASLPALPATIRQPENWIGVLELRVAPTNPNRLYMMWSGTVFRSDNRGQNWVKLDLDWGALSNDEGANAARFMGQKMAVDPINPDVVYVGTPSGGVYRSFNAGNTFTQISTGTIPACSTTFGGIYPGHPGICFDPTSGSTGGRTNKIYIPVWGTGVYASTDAGATWGATSGAPTKVRHGKVDTSGNYYVACNHSGDVTRTLNKWTGSWADITPSGITDVESVLIDPADATRVIAIGSGSTLYLSTNSGTSFGSGIAKTRTAPDIPWLAWTTEDFMSLGDMIFVGSDIWVAHGIGVAKTPFSGTPANITWTYITKGIENLTCNEVICPPNGPPLTASWDRPIHVITSPEVYPSTHGPDNQFRHGWDVDWASSDPSCSVVMGTYGSTVTSYPFGWKSTDKGANWTAFATNPGATGSVPLQRDGVWVRVGGCIAASTPNNIIAVPANESLPWQTKDGGTTWAEVIISGVPRGFDVTGASWAAGVVTFTSAADHFISVGSNFFVLGVTPSGYIRDPNLHAPFVAVSGTTGTTLKAALVADPGTYVSGGHVTPDTGYGFAYYVHNKPITADRVTANTFYAYNYLTAKVYRSTDSGDNWTEMNSTNISGAGAYGCLKSVPNNAGHLFLSGGLDGSAGAANPGTKILQRSINSGATWTEVAGGVIREPHAIGFGKAAPGGSYPSVAFAGWLDGVYGIYVSTDDCASWTSMGTFPMGWLASVKSLDGDKDVYGTWYVAIFGGSFAYRTEAMQYSRLR